MSNIIGGLISTVSGIFTKNIVAIVGGVGNLLSGITSSTTIDEVIEKLRAELTNSRRNLEQSKEKKKKLLDEISKNTVEINKLSGEIRNALETKNLCNEDVYIINDKIQLYSQNINEKCNKNGEKRKSLNEMRKKLDITRQEYSKLKNVDELRDKITEKQNSITSLDKDLKTFLPESILEAAKSKEKIINLDKQIEILKTKLETSNSELNKIKPNVAENKLKN